MNTAPLSLTTTHGRFSGSLDECAAWLAEHQPSSSRVDCGEISEEIEVGGTPAAAGWRKGILTAIVGALQAAAGLDELCSLMGEQVYEVLDGVYAGRVPTWGERTPEVERQVSASGPSGDIVSWDTTATPHRYLVRRSANGSETFRVVEAQS